VPDDWFRALADLNRSATATWQSLCRAWLDPFGFSTRTSGVGGDDRGFPNRGLAPWSGLGTLLGMPLDNWRRVVSTYSMAPGDMEKAIRQPGSPYGPETLHRTMVGFLSMPAIGYTREWQEEVQRWGLLWLDHWQALQDYTAVVFPSVFDALERFGGKLQDPEAGSEARNSLRAFYDLWIDCSEEAYGRLSFSPQFIDAQARLSNSLFALKRQEQGMMEEFQSTLNMPTRRELDTSHRRVHHLHRRLWQVEQALEERGQEQVQSELQSLRRELDELRRRLEAALPKS
jgi:class III poly(R)-hydroxyalkanoic acid synthase PhaE subunit